MTKEGLKAEDKWLASNHDLCMIDNQPQYTLALLSRR